MSVIANLHNQREKAFEIILGKEKKNSPPANCHFRAMYCTLSVTFDFSSGDNLDMNMRIKGMLSGKGLMISPCHVNNGVSPDLDGALS